MSPAKTTKTANIAKVRIPSKPLEKKACCPMMKSVLTAWLILATAYVVYDLWQDGLKAAYNAGRTEILAGVMSASGQCEQPVLVELGGNQVNLVNVACLQTNRAEAPEVPAASTETTEG